MKIDGLKDKGGKPLWEGHRNRLRLRLERDGWDALKPYEMVEIVLCHAMPYIVPIYGKINFQIYILPSFLFSNCYKFST